MTAPWYRRPALIVTLFAIVLAADLWLAPD